MKPPNSVEQCMEQTKRLLGIMQRLRDPADGCEWDLEQTFETIAPYTIEEAYEVADAIEKGDVDSIKEELGDLLFQVVFQAQVASDNNLFGFEDVAKSISDKMIHRHPHIFGDKKFTRDELKAHWEQSKAEERASKSSLNLSAIDGVALPLPALTRAEKIQKRASRVGFDWSSLEPVLAKIDEELAELRAVIGELRQHSEGPSSESLGSEKTSSKSPSSKSPSSKSPSSKSRKPQHKEGVQALEDELGDLLFTVTNVARHLRVDPELALRKSTAKFERRFRYVERAILDSGSTMDLASQEALDSLWQEVKREEQ